MSKDGFQIAWVQDALDWKSGKRFSDIYLSTAGGQPRRLTYTDLKNETAPAFSPDGHWLGFLSDRDSVSNSTEPEQQVYLLSPSGGEARKVGARVAGSAGAFAFSPDSKLLAFTKGPRSERQIYLLDLASWQVRELGKHATGVDAIEWSPDSSRVYFTSPDRSDAIQRRRQELRFDVRVVNEDRPPVHLWVADVTTGKASRLTSGDDITVGSFRLSRNGQWITMLIHSTDRYVDPLDRRDTEAYLYSVLSGNLTRLTDNRVAESLPQISPDGQWLAMRAPEEFFRRNRLRIRPTLGGDWKPVASDWPGDIGQFHWSADSKKIYFADGVGVNEELIQADIDTGKASQITHSAGALTAQYFGEGGGRFLLNYENPRLPRDLYLATEATLARRDAWQRVSNANPQIEQFALGQYETVQWKAGDGTMVEGLLVTPVGYKAGAKVPLIVQLHGGPASAYTQSFSNSWTSFTHVFAAQGYAVFQPNYRGSTNYGEKFKLEIAGDYFRQGFDDIMTGVDELIKRGVADPAKLGLMGWSAGGHWANWALTHTDRFKAISSGAGAVNWISMYAQTDMHETREFYFQGTPYENWDHYLAVSPLKYIKNAKTPTLIHVGHDDPRVPRPQSEELHMALKKLGVPTEFLVYPRMGHGLTEPRYQMVKMAADLGWFHKWMHGKKEWLDWKQLLDSVPASEDSSAKEKE